MTVRDRLLWKEWADRLRQEMMSSLTAQVTKSVHSITEESGSQKSANELRSRRFWNACQAGKVPNDAIVRAGFLIEFEPTEGSTIDTVTLRLNDTWQEIMQRVLDRRVEADERGP